MMKIEMKTTTPIPIADRAILLLVVGEKTTPTPMPIERIDVVYARESKFIAIDSDPTKIEPQTNNNPRSPTTWAILAICPVLLGNMAGIGGKSLGTPLICSVP